MAKLLHHDPSAGVAGEGNTHNYDSYLWKTAVSDALAFVLRDSSRSIIFANAIFMVTTFLGFCWWGTDTLPHVGLSVLVGLAAITLTYGLVVAVHLLYLTPKKLLAGKQMQVAALRSVVSAKETEALVLKRALAVKTVVKNERDEQTAA